MSALTKARAAWGDTPAWIVALASACDTAGSQAAVARRLGVSRPVVNNLLAARYTGRIENMKSKVETHLAPEMRRAEMGGWGDAPPDWIVALVDACARETQTVVARRIEYSPTVVSQVLSNTYKGNLRRVEMQVRGLLMGESVNCPLNYQPLSCHACVWNQETQLDDKRCIREVAARFRRTCPSCPNFLKTRVEPQS